MLAHALRERLKAGYAARDLRADVMAGLVVGILALPLAMALAIASGVPPQHGLYTAIVAGAVCALAGGSRFNVSGPTAAFVAILAPVAARYGVGGLATATFMAGAILVVMGLARMGRLIQYIPHPVTTGFTAGIAVVIATLQVKDFLGLTVPGQPEHYWERAVLLARALPSTRWGDAAIGCLTLALLLLSPRVTRRVPAPLIAIPVASLVALWIPAATIGTRFSFLDASGATLPGIPTVPPAFGMPWNLPGPGGPLLGLSWELVRELLMPATTIALLGAIESLLCAVVADGMAGTRHDPDAELLGQGLGNLAAPLFGGIAATGAIARTATNVRSGARSPVASAVHALFVLGAVLALGRWLRHVPMSALASLLLLAAWNMSDVRHVMHMIRVAPRSDVVVLCTCLTLTVAFDMVIAVVVGVVLAALLFMRRMVELASARFVEPASSPHAHDLPPGVILYEVAGPFFFGAAQKLVSALGRVAADCRAVVLNLSGVPVMDMTGLVALQSLVQGLASRKTMVILTALRDQPWDLLRKAGLHESGGHLQIDRTLEDSLAYVRARFR
ncbi:MAG: C4-dicarboxylic acid transporter DauA [Planctomycetaceae bacterium]